MGQRSQIYIRINDEDNNKILFAKYFQWNYGERMISRAKYGIEYIKRNIKYLSLDSVQERINKIFDINFDMQDIALSQDIIQEVRNDFWGKKASTNDYIFLNQDNNDGKLFVDCYQATCEIKYCFTDYDMNILTPNKYMEWDIGKNWNSSNHYSDYELNKNWQEVISICKDNIKFINGNAKMMNNFELEQFINDDYSKQIGNSKFKEFLQNFVEKGILRDKFWYFHIERIDENGSWKFYGEKPEEIYMQFNGNTKQLIVEPSFQKEYYEGIVEDIYDYYDLQNEKTLIENAELHENFNNKKGTNLEINEDKNENEFDYEYD